MNTAKNVVNPLIKQGESLASGMWSGARTAGQNIGPISQAEGRDVLHGALKPDGSHQGISLGGNISIPNPFGGPAIGFGGSIGLDHVNDYRDHQEGWFLTPEVHGNVSSGPGASLDLSESHGPIYSFGSNKGVVDGFQKWFTHGKFRWCPSGTRWW